METLAAIAIIAVVAAGVIVWLLVRRLPESMPAARARTLVSPEEPSMAEQVRRIMDTRDIKPVAPAPRPEDSTQVADAPHHQAASQATTETRPDRGRLKRAPQRETQRRAKGRTIMPESLVELGRTPFAVVDVETTGIYPGNNDRIIEIAIVRLRPNLDIEEEWSTLVNPKRDIGRSDIHGIDAGAVLHAPTFEDIAADVGVRLKGAVVVGHHLRFDVGFLSHEYRRFGVPLPQHPGLCTLDLAYQLLPDAPSRKLTYCCEQAGIRHDDDHTALGDARATAVLLGRFVELAKSRNLTTLAHLGCAPLDIPAEEWLASLPLPSGRRLGREQAADRTREERSYLARLVESMGGDEALDAREAEYLALVDRALEDRRVTEAEATMLVDMAESWGMTRADAHAAHRSYLASMVSEALADGTITPAELLDLDQVCELLGLHHSVLDALVAGASGRRSAVRAPERLADLRGKSVCFTGELLCTIRGERITREMAESMAEGAGLEVKPNVTKALEILVVADPDTQSIKAKKARQYGIRIIAEVRFWQALLINVDG